MNLEINLIFLIKLFFLYDQKKSHDKDLDILWTERVFEVK